MSDSDLSANHAPDRIPGPSGDAVVVVASTTDSTRSAALTVGQSYRVTAYGGAGHLKFGGSDVEADGADHHAKIGMIPDSRLYDLGLIYMAENFNYCAAAKPGAGDDDCTILLTPYS